MVFFAIWWAWMNFTWFASAYDCDDLPYRLTVFVQITGALSLAAGVTQLFEHRVPNVAVLGGYVVMRLAMVVQWLRASAGDPAHRNTARRYAIGISVLQVAWVLTLAVPHLWVPVFPFLATLELLVPVWAESAQQTTWHPHHISERYGLLTLIVLGESILAASVAIQSSLASGGTVPTLVPVVVGGLLTVYSMWWVYFDRPVHNLLTNFGKAMMWGYGHYFVFASAAAVGAGLGVAVDQAAHHSEVSSVAAGFCFPRGWLIQVAARRMTDHHRSETARRNRESALASELGEVVPSPELEAGPEQDDTLVLLFMCAHPALTSASAIALTLRAVGGLSTAEIASAFLVPEATMAQRISRAKQSIKGSSVPFSLPDAEERETRLGAVLHVLYLIFNEGYASSRGPELTRSDLSLEAIRLARAMHRVLPDDTEVGGLLALMLLTDARRRARTGPAGELIPLTEQDRTLWDAEEISEGSKLLAQTFSKGRVGAYQLQAAIAAVHDGAARAEDTDWPEILALYDVLASLSDNPMVSLNQTIAAAMVHGPLRGLELLATLDADERLRDHHRLSAVRAHFLEMAGNAPEAITHYRAAADRTTSIPERNYLLTQAARLGAIMGKKPAG